MKTEKEALESTLKKISNSRKLWVLWIFVLTASPGILNGMHVTSYVFLVGNDTHYCYIAELDNSNWTSPQIKHISSPLYYEKHYIVEDGCSYLNWNYSYLGKMSFEDALSYTKLLKTPKTIECTKYLFEENNTVISQWNLVCKQFYLRSNIQSIFALGKFCGAFVFGVIADRSGRKHSFTLAAIIYMISAPLAAGLDSFYTFLIARFIIGFAGVGCYATAYTLLSEMILGAARSSVCCLYNISYPIGMIILTFVAYYTPSWRLLQIIMSAPTLLLALNFWLLPESPNWLLSQGRNADAWNVIKKIDSSVVLPTDFLPYEKVPKDSQEGAWYEKLRNAFQKCYQMFSTSKLVHRSLICCFVWFTSSMTYYGLGILSTIIVLKCEHT